MNIFERLRKYADTDNTVVAHGNHDQKSHGNWAHDGVEGDIPQLTVGYGTTLSPYKSPQKPKITKIEKGKLTVGFASPIESEPETESEPEPDDSKKVTRIRLTEITKRLDLDRKVREQEKAKLSPEPKETPVSPTPTPTPTPTPKPPSVRDTISDTGTSIFPGLGSPKVSESRPFPEEKTGGDVIANWENERQRRRNVSDVLSGKKSISKGLVEERQLSDPSAAGSLARGVKSLTEAVNALVPKKKKSPFEQLRDRQSRR